MATNFFLFFLGVPTAGDGSTIEIDSVEGNTTSENHTALNGMSFDGAGSGIFNNLQELSPVDYSGGAATSYDANNSVSNDTFAIDGGAAQTHDVTMLYNNTVIEYADGSTVTVNAIVMQDTDGNLYLLPPTAGPNAYSDALEAAPIESVTLGTAVPSGGTDVYGMTPDRFVLDIPYVDTDNDGVLDTDDLDDDNDGILDTAEGYDPAATSTLTVTFDGDQWSGTENTWELRAPDGSLIASGNPAKDVIEITNIDVADLGEYSFTVFDSYGDGMDYVGGTGANATAGYTVAVNGTTVIDSGPIPTFGSRADHSFVLDETDFAPDSDGDGIVDYLDLDSDNDGITDNVEAQSTADYAAPTGFDSDGDGLDDAFDATPTTGAAGSAGLTPVNTDGTGLADYLDTDSDDDGIDDVDEAGHGISQAAIDASGDVDGDGIADVVDDVVGRDANDADVDASGNFTLADTDNDMAADGSNAAPTTTDFDFRDTVPCFTPGCLITTENGEVPVEDIRPGDMVLTVDNGFQPVRWVGSRTLTQVDLANNANHRPIVIRKGKFGNQRKMLVSPQHGLVVKDSAGTESLIRAKHIAETMGGKYGRVDKRCERVTYIHIMFDQHELIYAEGGITEAFYPGPVALKSMNRPVLEELLSLFPDLANVAFADESTNAMYGDPARPYMKRHEARDFAVYYSS